VHLITIVSTATSAVHSYRTQQYSHNVVGLDCSAVFCKSVRMTHAAVLTVVRNCLLVGVLIRARATAVPSELKTAVR